MKTSDIHAPLPLHNSLLHDEEGKRSHFVVGVANAEIPVLPLISAMFQSQLQPFSIREVHGVRGRRPVLELLIISFALQRLLTLDTHGAPYIARVRRAPIMTVSGTDVKAVLCSTPE